MLRWALIGAGIAGLLGVSCGAFGAHALAALTGEAPTGAFDTASRYHLIHSAALAAAALAPAAGAERRRCAAACVAWLVGMAIFSGTLYALAVTGATWLGAITPIGGLLLMAGWILLLAAAWRAGPA
jgi:uncharacterized membrane protein YgdD (TMEM256/DUF423 family)